jgi:hypothetical protein
MVFQENGSVVMAADVSPNVLTAAEKSELSATANCRGDVGRIVSKWLDKILIAKSRQIEQSIVDQQAELTKRKAALERMRK